MTLAELTAAKPGLNNWPNLIMDADGSHSRECNLLLEIADAELNSDKQAHYFFDQLQKGHAQVRDAALRAFVRLIRQVGSRNPYVCEGAPLSEHKARLLAFALLDRWINAAQA